MDRTLKLLVQTVFAGLVNTKDIYALYRRAYSWAPTRTLFVVDDDGRVCIDFEYGMFRASDYIGKPVHELNAEQLREHAARIACELAEVEAINDNLDAYVQRGVVRRLHSRLRRARRHPAAVDAIARTYARAQRVGVDSSFVRDALYP